jgi:peptidoglycan/LPS O-acetylase OafA/YrhL
MSDSARNTVKTKFGYRPEIDGLRAISVLGVVFFHAHIGLNGGFVGVDVFFVISGFLITSIIMKEIDAQSFSLRHFWERRVRRILPPLFVMNLVVLLAGFWVLLPPDLIDLGKSSMAQTLLASNFYFWQDVGYFAGPSELEPLLHTWSLAVEEQFYLFLPIVLCVLYSRSQKLAAIVFLLACLFSFAINVYGSYRYPSATFFLLPTRAWQLLSGSCLAFVKPDLSRLLSNVLALVGIVCIFAAMILFSSETRFPGMAALLPTLGPIFVILGSTCHRTVTGLVLSSKPLVFIGRVSYGFYLWHWPLLAFGRYVNDAPVSTLVSTLICTVAFFVSVISFYIVEEPIRKKRFITSSRMAFATTFIALFVVGGLSSIFWVSNGVESRIPPALRRGPSSKEFVGNLEDLRKNLLPTLGDSTVSKKLPSFIVWGDSHGGVLLPIFDRYANELEIVGLSASKGGHPPVPNVAISWNRNLPEWNDRILKLVRDKSIKHVFLVARWSNYVSGASAYDLANGRKKMSSIIHAVDSKPSNFENASILLKSRLSSLAEELSKEGCRVYVFTQCPEQDFHPQKRAFVASRLGYQPTGSGTSRDEHDRRQALAMSCLLPLSSKQVSVIDSTSNLFDENDLSVTVHDGRLTYRDNQHLSTFGAELALGAEIRQMLLDIKEAKN